MAKDKIGLIDHYRNLIFYNFNRFKDDNYLAMSRYLANVLKTDIKEFSEFKGKRLIDVGGGRGYYCEVLAEEHPKVAVNLDPDPFLSFWPGDIWPQTVVAVGEEIPFIDNLFDIVVCRGTLEHIPPKLQLESLKEMNRVLKPGGICYILVPPWYNPHAGHQLKPFHYLPFPLAKKLRQSLFKKEIKGNSYADESLYPLTFHRMKKIIRQADFKIIATQDAHFRIHFLTRIPIVREVLIPSVAFILEKQ